MADRKRRFKKGRIDFLSLCHRGANNLSVVYKAQENTRVVLKATEDKGEITALVYVPEVRDVQGEIASAPVIKDMAYGFAERGMSIDILHNEEPVGPDRAYVAENFIVQKGDPRFQGWKDHDGKPIDASGAWGVVVKVKDPALRALYRDGKWDGVSMGGDGDFIDETKVGKAQETTDMDEKQVTELVSKAVAAALEAAGVKKVDAKAKDPYAYPGDIRKATAKQLREHASSVKKMRMFEDVDLSDPEAVEAMADKIEADEKAVKKAKATAQAPVETDEDEGETSSVVTKGDMIEVEADEGEDEGVIQRREIAKFMVSRLPAARRVSAGK